MACEAGCLTSGLPAPSMALSLPVLSFQIVDFEHSAQAWRRQHHRRLPRRQSWPGQTGITMRTSREGIPARSGRRSPKASTRRRSSVWFWATYPYTLGGYASAKPGQYATMLEVAGEPALDGRLQFAASVRTTGDFLGYMNSSIPERKPRRRLAHRDRGSARKSGMCSRYGPLSRCGVARLPYSAWNHPKITFFLFKEERVPPRPHPGTPSQFRWLASPEVGRGVNAARSVAACVVALLALGGRPRLPKCRQTSARAKAKSVSSLGLALWSAVLAS